jgi:ATP-dependent RNA helicase DDX24/MAK5
LNDLSQLRFLVIDEADRMVKQGSFPQLSKILDAVQQANPMDMDDDGDNDEPDDNNEEVSDRLHGLPGIRGEARVQMLSPEMLERLHEQSASETPITREIDDDEYNALVSSVHMSEEEDVSDDELPLPPPVHRQTFVYSATLTLPLPAPTTSKKQKGLTGKGIVDEAIAKILRQSRASGKTKIIDLSHGKSSSSLEPKKENSTKEKTKDASKFRLPPGLRLQQITCTQLHKDSHLYAYLMTTEDGASGPCLVFCNSIAAVQRVGATLKMLGLEVGILHANMQQVCLYTTLPIRGHLFLCIFCYED